MKTVKFIAFLLLVFLTSCAGGERAISQRPAENSDVAYQEDKGITSNAANSSAPGRSESKSPATTQVDRKSVV